MSTFCIANLQNSLRQVASALLRKFEDTPVRYCSYTGKFQHSVMDTNLSTSPSIFQDESTTDRLVEER